MLPPRRLLPLALALALAAALLAPSLRGGFVWDDVLLIARNANVQSWSRLPRALASAFWDVSDGGTAGAGWRYYRPFVTLVYALAWHAFGGAAAGFRALNLAAHLGCVALAWAWLSRRFGPDALAGRGAPAATVALVLFAAHASRGESVAWPSGCTDVWMTFWMLAAHALWSRGATTAACAACALGVFSKEGAVALPLLLAADVTLGADADARPSRERLRAVVPLAVTVVACLALRAALVSEPMLARLGAWLPSAPARVVASFGGYVVRLVAPWPPRVLFPREQFDRLASAWGAVGVVSILALAALGVTAWRRPAWRPWLADALWLAVPLAPVVNVMPMFEHTFIAQRFLYLPALGLAALVLRALLAAPAGPARATAFALAAAAALVNAASLPLTAAFFRDDVTFWARSLDADPADARACKELGSHLAGADPARSLAVLARCNRDAAARGDHDAARSLAVAAAAARVNVLPAGARDELREVRGALDALAAGGAVDFTLGGRRFVARASGNGASRDDASALRSARAVALLRTGDLAGAERALRAVVAAEPAARAPLANLAELLGRQSRWAEARPFAMRALATLPADPYLRRLARSLDAGARLDAIADPRERAFRRAQVMLDLHAPAEAEAALGAFGDDAPPPVVMLRARAAVADGRVPDAVALVEAARARDPSHAAEWGRVLEQLRALRR